MPSLSLISFFSSACPPPALVLKCLRKPFPFTLPGVPPRAVNVRARLPCSAASFPRKSCGSALTASSGWRRRFSTWLGFRPRLFTDVYCTIPRFHNPGHMPIYVFSVPTSPFFVCQLRRTPPPFRAKTIFYGRRLFFKSTLLPNPRVPRCFFFPRGYLNHFLHPLKPSRYTGTFFGTLPKGFPLRILPIQGVPVLPSIWHTLDLNGSSRTSPLRHDPFASRRFPHLRLSPLKLFPCATFRVIGRLVNPFAAMCR